MIIIIGATRIHTEVHYVPGPEFIAYMHDLIQSSQQRHKAGNGILPAGQMKTLGKAKCLVQAAQPVGTGGPGS